jgi:SAM-dependent methyltransferase
VPKKLALTNVSFDEGTVKSLPYSDASFSIVLSRFTFHHFPDPLAVLKDMVRMCVPGGTVMVIDVRASDNSAKPGELNAMERLRDPSHMRAMPLSELQRLLPAAGLPAPRITGYELRDKLENCSAGRSATLATTIRSVLYSRLR